MQQTRRNFLKLSGIVSLGFLGLDRFSTHAATGEFPAMYADPGYGPLLRNADGLLDLPKGFSCKIISRKGDTMSDGLIVPGAHDGMGAFKWEQNKVMLIRNHELTAGSHGAGPFGKNNANIHKIDKDLIYDYGKGTTTCVGGTTTFLYNETTQQVELEYLSLAGTIRNCAGGVTPWNSWISCEEIDNRKGDFNGTLEKDHGYNFEVPVSDKVRAVKPVPIKAMGRFIHEAVAVHPETGIVYQTEDAGNSVFYRYLPEEFGKLHKGGKLQCLVIKEWRGADTRNWPNSRDTFPVKKQFEVEWVDLDNVEAPDNDLRLRGAKMGAATFANAEGIWYGQHELFFACTSGGKNAKGQIFKYIPSKYEGQPREKESPGKLELFIEPNDVNMFQNCDNLTIAPWGDVIICEDKSDPRIIGITAEGKLYPIAKNIGYRESEFAGPVFSPSGKTLFVNIQSPGLTLAITGPWKG